jgi:hypothetical protein
VLKRPPAASASMTGTPRSVSMVVTALLPMPMEPVRPRRNMLLGRALDADEEEEEDEAAKLEVTREAGVARCSGGGGGVAREWRQGRCEGGGVRAVRARARARGTGEARGADADDVSSSAALPSRGCRANREPQ